MLAALAVLVVRAPRGSRSRRDRPFALAFVGWNPLLAIHFAGGGHNDALMMALVLAALALAAAGRQRPGRRVLGGAIFVKWVPVVFLPCGRWRRARPAAASAISASRSRPRVAAVATLRYGVDWVRAFGPLARNAEGQTSYALPHRVEQLGVPHGVALGLAARRARRRAPLAGP